MLGRARGLVAYRPEGYGRGGDTSLVRVSMRASEFGIEADYCIGPTKLGGLDGDRRRPRRSRLRKLRWQAEMPQDPLNHTRLLNQRDEPEAPATARTSQDVEATGMCFTLHLSKKSSLVPVLTSAVRASVAFL